MKKPTIYLDTSVISAFWYESTDVLMVARRLQTREWWDLERTHFEIWASVAVESELRAGVFPRQHECLQMVSELRYLQITAAVRELSDRVLERRIVPEGKTADATHLAPSAWHGIDYLLTWNYAHMANPLAQSRFERICGETKLVAPLMVSPESEPQVRLGKTI